MSETTTKGKALELAVASIEKAYGKGSIMRLGEHDIVRTEVTPSGALSLDLALGSDIADSVLNSIYGDAIRPKLARLQWASPKWLAERISQEPPEQDDHVGI